MRSRWDVERIDASNSWVVAADSAPRRARAWATALAGGVWAAVVVRWAPVLPDRWVAGLGDPGDPWSFDIQGLVLTAAVFGPLVLAAMLGGLLEGRAVAPAGPRPFRTGLAGAAIGAAGFTLSLGVAFLAGAVAPGTGPRLTPALLAPALVNAITVFLAAAAEEVFFRGWLQPVLCGRWGARVGLLAAALLFAATHLVGAPRSAIAMVNILLAGVFFGLLALRSGGLACPIMAHFAWNWTEAGVFGTDPNPGGDPTGAILDVDLGGPALWSGGADTMNGSLATLLALVFLVLLAGLATPRRLGAR